MVAALGALLAGGCVTLETNEARFRERKVALDSGPPPGGASLAEAGDGTSAP